MSLKDFAQGGFEVADAKILVIVKSISTRKKGERGLQHQADARLIKYSHEERWNHRGTRQGRCDGRYKRSNTVLMGCHFNKPNGLAAITNRAVDHEPQSEYLTSKLVSTDIQYLHRRGSQYSRSRKASSICRTDDQEAADQSSFSLQR
jgi:hypothetical protein